MNYIDSGRKNIDFDKFGSGVLSQHKEDQVLSPQELGS